ncbi:UNVERIFIED_CONTAM: hypothetical protein PYX00_003542 [Menopon gallinae]|uniref:Sodium-coupled monocarboxylate transporter 1 n=1 Tax=Menopon gallinae TaxID=328185 RepID=A0AAW2I2B6_9NEOP
MTGNRVFVLLLVWIMFNDCGASDSETVNNTTCSDLQKNYFFAWEDYVVIFAVILISCAIGIFYCACDRKQITSSDFLLGGSKTGSFPMAMSLTSGFITAIELLGNPAEMYNFGIQLWMCCISLFLVVPLTSNLYLPVFMELRLTSCYEYLQLRFHQSARTFGSTLYIIQMVLYTSVAVYAPALALSNVTGLNVYLAVSLIYVVCIFYASQGGMKAVIITDTFQALVLIGSILAILILGNNLVGGTSVVFADSLNSKRLNFLNMYVGPGGRHDVWAVIIGGTFYWATMFCSNQASIQKYLSVETLKEAKRALWVSCWGLTLIFTINFYTGMILYSAFKNCDPVHSGEIFASDELLPYFVMKSFSYLKGIPGFFVAGIFSASLGTVAAALNSLAAVSVKDFLTGAFGISISESREAQAAKWLSITFGIISFGFVLLVEELGSVLQAALSFNGMIGGITLGMFSLGMFFPWANTKGVVIGSLSALVVILWIGIGAQIVTMQGALAPIRKETSLAECACFNSSTRLLSATESETKVFALYKISFLWYSAISFSLTVVIGILFSFLTGAKNACQVDLALLSPPIRKLMRRYRENLSESAGFPIHDKMSTKTSKIPRHFTYGIANLAVDLKDEKLPEEYVTTSS